MADWLEQHFLKYHVDEDHPPHTVVVVREDGGLDHVVARAILIQKDERGFIVTPGGKREISGRTREIKLTISGLRNIDEFPSAPLIVEPRCADSVSIDHVPLPQH